MAPDHTVSDQADAGLQASWPTEPAGEPPDKGPKLHFLRELPALISFALILALLMKTFLLQMFFIPSASMEPTLHGCTGCNNDRVAVNKLVYRFREPRRGEIIVFIAHQDDRPRSLPTKIWAFLTEGIGLTAPGDGEQDYIKRVIGLPGEKIKVTAKQVWVKQPKKPWVKLDEPYIELEGRNISTMKPFRVPDDEYFVMGDNRNNSSDSRSSLGPIPRDRIIGKAFVRIWPPTRVDLLDEPVYDDPVKKKPQRGKRGSSRRSAGIPAEPFVFPLVALAGAGAVARARLPRS
jgi:signal peptidase I